MREQKSTFLDNYFLEIIWIMTIGVFWRLIPHLPNLTPFIALSLFAGAYLSRATSFLVILAALFISDVGLALILGYPVVSYYTLFTYTGFLGTVLAGSGLLNCSKWKFPICFVGASFGFWLWTNFGVWLVSGFYSKNLTGFLACYSLALPFLRNALIGDLVWGVLIFGVFSVLLKRERTDEKSVRSSII